MSRRLAPLKDQSARVDRAARSRHRLRRGRYRRRSRRRDRAPPRADRSGVEQLAAALLTAGWCTSGFTLAIVGRPNVGKSSLFNRLLEQDRAIVTDIAGTTRDLVSETAAIDGIPVTLRRYGWASARAQDLVEQLGIERSYQAMADADLTLVVVDQSQPLSAEDDAPRRTRALAGPPDRRQQMRSASRCRDRPAYLPVSALTGEGVRELAPAIVAPLAPDGRLEHRKAGSSPRSGTSNCCGNRSPLSDAPAPRWASGCRTKCCCWISMPRYSPSTPSLAPPRRTTFSTGSSRRSVSASDLWRRSLTCAACAQTHQTRISECAGQ